MALDSIPGTHIHTSVLFLGKKTQNKTYLKTMKPTLFVVLFSVFWDSSHSPSLLLLFPNCPFYSILLYTLPFVSSALSIPDFYMFDSSSWAAPTSESYEKACDGGGGKRDVKRGNEMLRNHPKEMGQIRPTPPTLSPTVKFPLRWFLLLFTASLIHFPDFFFPSQGCIFQRLKCKTLHPTDNPLHNIF